MGAHERPRNNKPRRGSRASKLSHLYPVDRYEPIVDESLELLLVLLPVSINALRVLHESFRDPRGDRTRAARWLDTSLS